MAVKRAKHDEFQNIYDFLLYHSNTNQIRLGVEEFQFGVVF